VHRLIAARRDFRRLATLAFEFLEEVGGLRALNVDRDRSLERVRLAPYRIVLARRIEACGNDGNDDLVAQALVEARAEDDVRRPQ
jgi:hypothetical protein